MRRGRPTNHVKLTHSVIVKSVEEVNQNVRILKLAIKGDDIIEFQPGQWLDVYVPTDVKPGGFSITSSPSKARPANNPSPYVELSIQKSSTSKPARWLWSPKAEIIGRTIHIRVGGSFIWPPSHVDVGSIKRLIFVAGGMGINPLMSMISSLLEAEPSSIHIELLYSTKCEAEDFDLRRILFFGRIADAFQFGPLEGRFRLFLTKYHQHSPTELSRHSSFAQTRNIPVTNGRITHDDLQRSIGDEGATSSTLVFLCGPPKMIDDFVKYLTDTTGLGLSSDQVVFEKWW